MVRMHCMLFLLQLLMAVPPSSSIPEPTVERHKELAVQMAREALVRAKTVAEAHAEGAAWSDCAQLYEDSERRLERLAGEYEPSDALTWLSGALTGHSACVEGLRERNVSVAALDSDEVSAALREALAAHASPYGRAHSRSETNKGRAQWNTTALAAGLMLVSWDASTDHADIVVSQDGSGNYKTISEAVSGLSSWRHDEGSNRVIIYVKSGVYSENVEIGRNAPNLMFIGDGIDKTVVTGSRSVPGGFTTYQSATFGVSSDGFWARDMTFENTAGPEKHQAVALRVASDLSVFYRCSFKGYQDTLFVLSQRQFYRDCQIYGTVDFIFGNAAAVLQNCDIFVRRPMWHQANMITAQGRDDARQNTGIAVHASRVLAASDLEDVKSSFRSYLGRPWQRYSRTVFMKTDLDALVNPEGWAKWSGDFALDTLYFGECQNTGQGAATDKRVNWPGFHVITDSSEATQFSVENFIQGWSWLPQTGVPFWAGI